MNAFRNSVMKIARRVFRTEPEQLAKLDFQAPDLSTLRARAESFAPCRFGHADEFGDGLEESRAEVGQGLASARWAGAA